MLHHLLKLIWQRKTRNLMLSLEILLAFVLVFAIAAFATRSYQLYQMPLGFAYQDVWSVELHIPNDGHMQSSDAAKPDPAILDQFQRNLKAMPEVQELAFALFSPFSNSAWRTEFALPNGGPKLLSNFQLVSDDFFITMGMPLAQGQGFSAADDGSDAIPVVINRQMASAAFGEQSALGKTFTDAEGKTIKTYRVTGVVDSYRDGGELMAPVHYTITRYVPGPKADLPKSILLKLKPGTARSFEARLNRELKAIRGDWSYTISPLSDLRRSVSREKFTPLVVLSVIAAFLLVMVAFGLFGVLWQNTTQRIPEIGLRRAVGAQASQIYRQIIAEQLLLSSVAMLVALALLLQLPLTGALGENLNWPVFGVATGLSMAVIYLISVLCALYPGWQASRLSPVQALHYE